MKDNLKMLNLDRLTLNTSFSLQLPSSTSTTVSIEDWNYLKILILAWNIFLLSETYISILKLVNNFSMEYCSDNFNPTGDPSIKVFKKSCNSLEHPLTLFEPLLWLITIADNNASKMMIRLAWILNLLKFEQRSGKGGAQSCIPLAADIRDKLNWMAVAKMEAVFPCDSLF